MATTPKNNATKNPAPTPTDRKIPVHQLLMRPEVQAAVGIVAWSNHLGEPDLAELVDSLKDRTKVVAEGNMRPLEAMLVGQAEVLQSMFVNLARRAAMQEYLTQYQTYAVLALKAQAQCRATLVALAEIKNPRPVQFVGQANIAQNQQVINGNGSGTRTGAGAGKPATEQSKLLDATHERLDTGPTIPASAGDSALETVGTGDRPAHG